MRPLTAKARTRSLFCLVATAFVMFVTVAPSTRAAAGPGERPRQACTAASTTYLSEAANLHLVVHQGTQILHEEGQASGTLRGRLTVVIDIGYTEATVSFTARSSAGTFTGSGVESYYVSGKNAHFKGRMAVTGGTGRYANVSASDLQTTGLIKRAHYEVVMTVDGELKR